MKKNIFLEFISLISYKKKPQPKEFYIPEINEGKSDDKNEEFTEVQASTTSFSDGREITGIKKPIPVSEINKAKKGKRETASDTVVSNSAAVNMEYIRKKFNYPLNKDIVIREFSIMGRYKSFLAYLDGMVDKFVINDSILRPLLTNEKYSGTPEECPLDYILENIIETNSAKKVTNPDDVIYEILTGNTVLNIDGCNFYISNETKGYEKRSVDTPQTEGVVIGPQEAYTETLRTNITLIRKIIKNNNLTAEFIKVGKRNQVLCAVVYINGLANTAVVDEVKRRIKGISTDFILGDGMLEQYMDDQPYSILPSVLSTERPDRTASHLVEGKVAVLVEGTPFAKIMPVSFETFMHSSEDYFMRWQFGSFLRIIRHIALFFAAVLPGLYVAMTTFHQEMIPTDLLIAIAKAKENVPFPTIVEVLLMEMSFELIREAGVRIPGLIGNTLGIIGALILGQAAVQANIVSPVLIIVVAITGLGNFAIPNFSMAFSIRLLRFLYILAGAYLGFYGISIMFLITAVLAADMKSFGSPYFAPVAPKTRRSFDYFLRWPLWFQRYRSDYVNSQDTVRQPEISRKWTREDPVYHNDKEEGKNDQGR